MTMTAPLPETLTRAPAGRAPRLLASHQPNFLPNLGFFYKMASADLFVVTTALKFERREGWQRRHKIRGPGGDQWLTVPVSASDDTLIRDVLIDNSHHWRHKHRKSLRGGYARTPERALLEALEAVFQERWERLVDLNMRIIHLLKDYLGITTEIVLDEETTGVKHHLLVALCKKYGAEVYLSGPGARDYMTEDRVADLAAQHVGHEFLDRDLTAQYPYSAVHYLLAEGRDAVRHKLGLTDAEGQRAAG